jgi:mono/diheme cytochrome c family protein
MLRVMVIACTWALACAAGFAQAAKKPQKFSKKQIAQGAEIYARNCSPCHGAHMDDPNGAFDLRSFPPNEHARFVDSVTNGKNSMPPWGSLLKPADIDALWAYVMAGEKHKASSKPR